MMEFNELKDAKINYEERQSEFQTKEEDIDLLRTMTENFYTYI